ncbi:MAG: hypothetical protein CVV04_07125 [Firmicutes bacterium HGW-Firmicutes-9]|jgi:hypothetical protein|nr:MAG: hypothetical protein CVV04_07125 [Firmicutes bacterium HGW-Firmicutes-9]
MKIRNRTLFLGLFLVLVGIACVALLQSTSKAEEDDDWMNGGPHPPISGNGWAIDEDGIMTVVSDAGWQDFLANGPGDWIWEYEDATVIERVQKLIIGKNVTTLSIYDPTRMNEQPMEDVAVSFCYGAGIYKPYVSVMFQDPKCMPPKIEVEEGNRVFSVEKGLLINNVKHSVVLSEIDVSDVVIPSGIREIEAWAFYYRNIKSVLFPKSLKTIGAAAFSKCNYLTEVYLPNTLTRMDTCAFADCESLKNVTISSGLKTIEGIAFRRCPLENVTIPQGVQTIGFMAFTDCDELVQVTLPESLTKIDNYAFSTCKKLEQINLPPNLSYIGYRAFEFCDGLKTIQLPNKLTTMGEEAFLGCTPVLFQLPKQLKVEAIPTERRGWYSDFSEDEPSTRQLGIDYVQTLIVSGSRYSMGEYLVKSADLVVFLQNPPADWKKITPEISTNKIYFMDQSAARWRSLDQSVWGDVQLVRISQKRLDEIMKDAENAAANSSLPQETQAQISETHAPDFDGSGWSFFHSGALEIRSNDGWLNWLRQNEHVSTGELFIGRNVTELTFYDMSKPVPVKGFYEAGDIIGYTEDGSAIYPYAASSLLNPTEIFLDEDNQSFLYLDGMLIDKNKNEVILTDSTLPLSVVVPEGIRSIGVAAFKNRHITSIFLPSSLEQIGDSTFENCRLKSIHIPNSVTSIGKFAFQSCEQLRTVILPESLQTIEEGTFLQSGITQIVLPSGVQGIGNDAFAQCPSLNYVQLSAKLQTIGYSAFKHCDKLSYVWFSNKIESIGPEAFSGCKSLKEVILPDTLTTIGTNVFSGCKLTLLRIPPELHIYEFDFNSNTFRMEASSTTQNLGLDSVETVIFSGSNYDLGDPAFYKVGNASFQSFLPKNVNALLPENTTGSIECSDKAKQQWVISEIPEWIRKKVTFVPATQVDDWVKSLVNATPKPTNIPEPTDTPQPTKTPQPSRAPQPTMTPQPTYAGFHVVNTPKPKATPQPTASPEPATESKKQSADPMLFVFAGVLAAVIAGIVALTLKSRQAKKKP